MLEILNAARRIFAVFKAGEAELINGPHFGYFVAAYSLPVVDGFIAYAKVFRDRPGNPWEGFAIAKYAACSSSSRTALQLAESRAVNAISRWNA